MASKGDGVVVELEGVSVGPTLYGKMMANTDRNCSVLKLANTFGSEMSVERNSSMRMAMWTVAEILDRLSRQV